MQLVCCKPSGNAELASLAFLSAKYFTWSNCTMKSFDENKFLLANDFTITKGEVYKKPSLKNSFTSNAQKNKLGNCESTLQILTREAFRSNSLVSIVGAKDFSRKDTQHNSTQKVMSKQRSTNLFVCVCNSCNSHERILKGH